MQTTPYCGAPPLPSAVSWNLDPYLLGGLLILAAAYLSFADRRKPDHRAIALFLSGWLILSFALISPLCNLSVALFSARVGQHMLIEFVAAPLVACGLPWWHEKWNRASLKAALLGALPFAAALWFWHLPAPYEWTFRSVTAYWAMHITLLISATLLWKVLLSRDPAASLLVSGITTAQMTVLGAIYTFAGRAFFTVHAGTTVPWGMSPLEDQQLGGLVMWIPPGLALAGIAVWSLAALLNDTAQMTADHLIPVEEKK